MSEKWIKHILRESVKVASKAAYNKNGFASHRKTENGGFWLTDILEGDYYFDKGDLKQAAILYQKVIDKFPENIWGYLKAADALTLITPAASIKLLKRASQIVPSYHGTWLNIAQIEYETGNTVSALKSAEKSYKINPFDTETSAFIKFIKENSSIKKL